MSQSVANPRVVLTRRKKKMGAREFIFKVLMYAFLTMAATVVLIPLISLFTVSLQPADSSSTSLSWPDSPDWENYVIAWTKGDFPLPVLMMNSFLVALAVVPIGVTVSVLAGYAFGTMKFPGSNVFFYVFMIGLVMPFEATIVPLYYQLREMGLINNLWGVIMPQVALFCAFGIFWMRQFFMASPPALVEAARIDGASSLRILRSVLLPIAWPPVFTLATLMFIWSWNEFLLSLVVLDRGNRTAPSGLGTFTGQWVSDIPALSAAAIIIALPTILIYVALNRKIISGVLQGAVKG
jgi:raffinose/stachyose/melibiose transport system permease protein